MEAPEEEDPPDDDEIEYVGAWVAMVDSTPPTVDEQQVALFTDAPFQIREEAQQEETAEDNALQYVGSWMPMLDAQLEATVHHRPKELEYFDCDTGPDDQWVEEYNSSFSIALMMRRCTLILTNPHLKYYRSAIGSGLVSSSLSLA